MGTYPFEAQNEGALIRKILRGTFTPVQGPYSPSLVQISNLLLTFDPNKRPDTQQLLRMPIIQSQVKPETVLLPWSAWCIGLLCCQKCALQPNTTQLPDGYMRLVCLTKTSMS